MPLGAAGKDTSSSQAPDRSAVSNRGPLVDTLLGDEQLAVLDPLGGGKAGRKSKDSGKGSYNSGGDASEGDQGGNDQGGDDLPAPDAPTLGEDMNVEPDDGEIRVKLPEADNFVKLGKDASIPFGSVVDARLGTVTLTTAHNGQGVTQSAAFRGSVFKVTQDRAAKPITELHLRGGDFSGCRRAPAAGAATIASVRRRSRRHLWGSGHGRFRTIGRHGAATVRGTIWLTADRCDGTLVRVRRGRVEVRDFRARKTVFVRAGHSYFARKHARHHRRR